MTDINQGSEEPQAPATEPTTEPSTTVDEDGKELTVDEEGTTTHVIRPEEEATTEEAAAPTSESTSQAPGTEPYPGGVA